MVMCTLNHKILECAYIRKIWEQTQRAIAKISDTASPSLDCITNVMGASRDDTVATLTIKAEIIQTILRFKPDQNYLTLPKLIVQTSIKRLICREKKEVFKEAFIKALG